jgi:Ca2+-binding RTX toxin-like protein
VDLSWAAAQVVAFTLKLTLGSATTIENVVGTSLPDTITGNSLANSLWGGGGNDTLQGGSGIDCLKGGEGDDRLEGGADNDNLHGGTGNDTLFGEAGDDLLYGEDGRDSLYGGDGTDWIHGGSGNDGLFGGIGCSDRLYGGPDADRFLEFEGEEVLVDCIAGTDAQIHFRDGAQITRSLFGENQTYAAGSWTDAEIIEVDGGLSYLHTTTGNTRLLRFGSTDGMTFVRQGSRTVGSRELAGGWNSGDGTQYFTAHGMAHVDVTVVHEAAHDWDDPAETQFATQFRQISDWTTTTAETHTQSGDGQWYWLSTTANTFARGYGRYNPFEDWATTWEAAYARDSRSNPLNLTLDSQKLAVIDAFFRSVS